jgi:hypothetical protein
MTGQWVLGRPGRHLLPVRLLAVFTFSFGLMLANARATVEGLLNHRSAFVRTPKKGAAAPSGAAYRTAGPSGLAELSLAALLVTVMLAEGRLLSPLLVMAVGGLSIMGTALLRERLRPGAVLPLVAGRSEAD